MDFPKVWELIEHFKNRCRLRGWKAYEHEDLVEVRGEYHNFLWLHRVNLNTFDNVVMNPWYSIREGTSYRTVRVSYMAWVLRDSLPGFIEQAIIEDPNLSRRVAIYDLGQAYAGRPLCLKINETDSVVFQEFERFLNTEYELELKPIYTLPSLPLQSISSGRKGLALMIIPPFPKPQEEQKELFPRMTPDIEAQNKIFADSLFADVLKAIEIRIRSFVHSHLLKMSFTVSFRRDIEVPEWRKIILRVDAPDIDFDQKMVMWDKIDAEVRQALHEVEQRVKGSDKDKIKAINRNLFIRMELP